MRVFFCIWSWSSGRRELVCIEHLPNHADQVRDIRATRAHALLCLRVGLEAQPRRPACIENSPTHLQNPRCILKCLLVGSIGLCTRRLQHSAAHVLHQVVALDGHVLPWVGRAAIHLGVLDVDLCAQIKSMIIKTYMPSIAHSYIQDRFGTPKVFSFKWSPWHGP